MKNNLFSDSDFNNQFNSVHKTVKRTIGVAIFVWFLFALASLSLVGVAIWALFKLVTHLTA